MASSLEDLLNLKVVVAAGEFGPDGSLHGYQASVDFSVEQAQQTAKFTSAVTQVFDVLAETTSAVVLSRLIRLEPNSWCRSTLTLSSNAVRCTTAT